jgi:hypothetical protein
MTDKIIHMPASKAFNAHDLTEDGRKASYVLIAEAFNSGTTHLSCRVEDARAGDQDLGDWEIVVRRVR